MFTELNLLKVLEQSWSLVTATLGDLRRRDVQHVQDQLETSPPNFLWTECPHTKLGSAGYGSAVYIFCTPYRSESCSQRNHSPSGVGVGGRGGGLHSKVWTDAHMNAKGF